VACAALLIVDDWSYGRAGDSFFPGGPLDEIAHILTALLVLEVLPRRVRDYAPFWVLLGSFAIDVDHIPGYLGHQFLTVGTPRPYTHALLTLVVLLAVGLAWRRGRRALFALSLGVALHFIRDLAEGGGAGVSLLWPLSDHGFRYPHSAYVALVLVVTAGGVVIALMRERVGGRVPARLAGSSSR
jgi:inner membrane protein